MKRLNPDDLLKDLENKIKADKEALIKIDGKTRKGMSAARIKIGDRENDWLYKYNFCEYDDFNRNYSGLQG